MSNLSLPLSLVLETRDVSELVFRNKTKNPFTLFFATEEVSKKELSKIKIFDNENQAVRWLSGKNVKVNKKDIS